MKAIEPVITLSEPLPLYSTKVQAGFPSPAEGDVENKLDLNEYLIDHPVATFFVRVAGDSMIEAGIHENDILVVDKSLNPVDGKIVVAVINGEFTVKRLRYKKDKAYLVPENKNYSPIILASDKEGDGSYIWGVVTSIIRKL
jgi:DNA polymerase V